LLLTRRTPIYAGTVFGGQVSVAVAIATGYKPRSRRRRTVVAGVADEVAVEILLAEVAGERSVVVD